MKLLRTTIASLIIILVGVFNPIKLLAQDTGAGHKIVFQLTDNDEKSHKALNNQLKNLTEGWPDAEFEVVVHSAGINYLQKSKSNSKDEIEALTAKGVKFKACENTLKSKNIDKSDILEAAGFVQMGIAEVVLKQEAGWSYIKAGF